MAQPCSAEPPPASQYVDELKRYTRHGHVIADFDEALTVDATLHAPQFRAAYAEKWIDTYKLNAEDAAKKRADLERVKEQAQEQAEDAGKPGDSADIEE